MSESKPLGTAIRLATPNDAEAIRKVYAPYVATPITFEEEEPAPAGFFARMEDVMAFYPCLVACECAADGRILGNRTNAGCGGEKRIVGRCADAAGDVALGGSGSPDGRGGTGEAARRIVGFAYAHRQAERAAYDWNAELSIYLRQGETHRGVGSALYGALMELLALQGIRCAYARVTLPNAASERLHARFGFDTMGIQRNAGFKSGAWRDVAWFVKPLGSFDGDPKRPRPFPALLKENAAEIDRIIQQANARLG